MSIVGATCAGGFAWITEEVLDRAGHPLAVDSAVYGFVDAHRASWFTSLMHDLTAFGSLHVLIPVGLAVGAFGLVRHRDWRPLLFLAASLAGAVVLYKLSKSLIGRLGPVALRAGNTVGHAYPAGLVMRALSVWGVLAVLVALRWPRLRPLAIAGASAIVIADATARLYLGLHWLTDVAAAIALGGAWLAIVTGAVILSSREPVPPSSSPHRTRMTFLPAAEPEPNG